MNSAQCATLLDSISESSGNVHESATDARLAQIKAGLDHSWFAWSDWTTTVAGKSGTAYYRIQGPRLVIEYAPQATGRVPLMHLHRMYRDPTNDYGRNLTGK